MKKKHNEKHSKKIRNLVAFCSLCAILLSVSTYAWFIGMTKVSVDKFEINIATTEGLFLSMDGVNWYYNLDAKNTAAYANNANVWADETNNKGLIPMSTVGDMDETSSRMKLYEKASFTAVPGGYRLLSSQVNNYTNTNATSGEYLEGKGYVAFDLFVKNDSGTEYYATNNPLNEEAIYLNTNSKVTVASNGDGGEPNSGIENSVRVAFVQIGRVKGTTTDQATITGIKCADTYTADDAGQKKLENRIVTGICRDAQIWEPNDKNHVQNAINWYQTSCLKRNPTTATMTNDVNDAASYNADKCLEVKDGTAYKTYAVSREITVDDEVNLYDGEIYNTFKANSIDYKTYAATADAQKGQYKLVDFPYFTDTTKELKGNQRVEFMTLAPNSITKLRVYVYIEGQDIDNYDFAQLGKVITVNFGFTKERYEQTDITDYNGPSTNITPTTTTTVAS